jgi:hypothetical protein
MTSKLPKLFRAESRVAGKGSLFASLTINIILLYVVNNLRYMGITQLTEANLVSCLWSVNIIFGLAIVGNFSLLLKRPAWFFYLVQTLINIAGVNAFYFIYKLYPFNLASAIQNQILKILIVLILIGFFLFFLFNFFRFGINFNLPKKKPAPDVVSVETGTAITTGETPLAENQPLTSAASGGQPLTGEPTLAPPPQPSENTALNNEPPSAAPDPSSPDQPL